MWIQRWMAVLTMGNRSHHHHLFPSFGCIDHLAHFPLTLTSFPVSFIAILLLSHLLFVTVVKLLNMLVYVIICMCS